MEVHHHSHTERKKFKHYLFEFFMLFLAVFCGFLAENFREHQIEHKREKQYMVSLTEDLVKDTSMLTFTTQRALGVIRKIDTALAILQQQKFDEKSAYILYGLNLGFLANFGPAFTDRTAVQLKNSGSMRLIRSEDVTGDIIDYWNKTSLLIGVNNQIDDYKIKAREKTYSIFDQKYYSTNSNVMYVNQPAPRLMINDPMVLTELANRLSHIRSLTWNVYIPQLKMQYDIAHKLISLVKREYHLK